MIHPDLLKKIIVEQRNFFLRIANPIAREAIGGEIFDKVSRINEAVIITGARRSGKSFLLKLIWQKIRKEQNIAENNFFCFNFEDERLLNFRAGDFDLMMEAFEQLFSVDGRQRVYLFFDEIQVIKGWEKFINRLLRQEKYKIFITGSNATLLSKEIDSALTGRTYPIGLFPLSFREFAAYKTVKVSNDVDLHQSKIQVELKKLFSEYMENGGFPEVVLQNFRPVLQEYLKSIIYRDVVSRYKIKQEANLREIAAFAISNIGSVFSLEKIARMAKMKNLTTVKNYLSYLENSFLFYRAAKYSHSLKTQIYNPDKFYAVDVGFYNEVAFAGTPNRGRILENLVFMELKRRYGDIYYFQGKRECDFLVKIKNELVLAAQATVFLDGSNREREIGGLLEAMDEYQIKNGLILVEDGAEMIKNGDKTIEVKPIWRWCMEH
jgi:predicted AAA+ superfamily ATPase